MGATQTAGSRDTERDMDRATNGERDPLAGIPEELQIQLGAALDWMENRTQTSDKGVRLEVDGEEVELREWSAQDLATCFEAEGSEAEPYREAVLGLALVLKVRTDLEEEDLDALQVDLGLFPDVFSRLERTIDAAVLRGGLVAARNLSRFREILLAFRSKAEARAVSEEQRQREKRRTTLQATGKVFHPSAPAGSGSAADRVRKPHLSQMEKLHERVHRAAEAATRQAEQTRRQRAALPRLATGRQRVRFPYLFLAVVVMALAHWGLLLHARAVGTQEPTLDRQAWERLVPLERTFVAGGVFYGTVSRDWHEMGYRDRRDRFERLIERARLSGFEAVVLQDSAGAFEARWSAGGVAQVWTNGS